MKSYFRTAAVLLVDLVATTASSLLEADPLDCFLASENKMKTCEIGQITFRKFLTFGLFWVDFIRAVSVASSRPLSRGSDLGGRRVAVAALIVRVVGHFWVRGRLRLLGLAGGGRRCLRYECHRDGSMLFRRLMHHLLRDVNCGVDKVVAIRVRLQVQRRDCRLRRELLELEVRGLAVDQREGEVAHGPEFLRKPEINFTCLTLLILSFLT